MHIPQNIYQQNFIKYYDYKDQCQRVFFFDAQKSLSPRIFIFKVSKLNND